MAYIGFTEFTDVIRGVAYAPATATLCSLIILLWVFHRFSVQRKNTLRLPPGPFQWPIIGNLNQLRKLPHRDLHKLALKYGPVMFLKLGSVPSIVVSSSAMAKEVLKTKDIVFANRPDCATGKYLAYNYKDMVFSSYGPYWRHMRKLCVVELLNNKRIESFRGVREEAMLSTVRSVWEMSGQGRKAVNLAIIFASFALEVMCRILTGNNFSSQSNAKEIKKLVVETAGAAGAINIGDFIPAVDWLDLQGLKRRMKKLHSSMEQLIKKIIHERQQCRMNLHKEHEQQGATKGIIDVLLELESLDGMPITQQNIEAIVFDMFIGGIETTSTTLEWAMSEVVKTPRVAKKMQEEIESAVGRERTVSEHDIGSLEYVQCVVKETLRLYPALPLLLPHESAQDCTVGGYFIPARSRLLVNNWAIGRDPSVWEDPLEFRPERFMGRNVDVVGDREFFDMLPFGAGRRGCPGAAMADVTMTPILAQLIHCFDWSVDGDLDMTELFGATTPKSVNLIARPALRLSTCP